MLLFFCTWIVYSWWYNDGTTLKVPSIKRFTEPEQKFISSGWENIRILWLSSLPESKERMFEPSINSDVESNWILLSERKLWEITVFPLMFLTDLFKVFTGGKLLTTSIKDIKRKCIVLPCGCWDRQLTTISCVNLLFGSAAFIFKSFLTWDNAGARGFGRWLWSAVLSKTLPWRTPFPLQFVLEHLYESCDSYFCFIR